ncbi:hypothetical protein TNCV_4042981 [Trichonephila clavipes]|nr:hypothetical protein TNCV_4042981 [Trichonephila clavipes]
MSSDTIRNNLNEYMTRYDYYSERFFALSPVLGKKATLECCMKKGLMRSSYVCPNCGKSMQLRERTDKKVNDDFQMVLQKSVECEIG